MLAECNDEHGSHWYMNWPLTVVTFVGGVANAMREVAEDWLWE